MLADPIQSFLSHLGSRTRIVQLFFQGYPKGFGIAVLNDDSTIAFEHLRNSSDRGRHDRTSTGHTFDYHIRETFGVRRQGKDGAGFHCCYDVFQFAVAVNRKPCVGIVAGCGKEFESGSFRTLTHYIKMDIVDLPTCLNQLKYALGSQYMPCIKDGTLFSADGIVFGY